MPYHTCPCGLVSSAQKQNVKGSAVVNLTLSAEQDFDLFSYPLERLAPRWDFYRHQLQRRKLGLHMILPLCNSDTSEEVTKKTTKQKRNKIKQLNPHRDVATAVLSHNVTSLTGRGEELRREDPEQEALGKYSQDSNPRMLTGADGAVLAFGMF